eukprot:scaffold7538_cov235-Skeletonema_marinoi.AAC.5
MAAALHEDDEVLEKNHNTDQYDDYMKLTEAKRRGQLPMMLSSSAVVPLQSRVVLKSSDQIPDAVTFLDEASLDSDKASLLDAAGKVGGLEDAGERSLDRSQMIW